MGNLCGSEKPDEPKVTAEKRASVSVVHHNGTAARAPSLVLGSQPGPFPSNPASRPPTQPNSRPNSQPNSQPNSRPGTSPNTPIHSVTPPEQLPTVGPLTSPFTGRAIASEPNGSPTSADSYNEDAPIALDIRVDSGGDAAESYWKNLLNRDDNKRTFRQVDKPGARNAKLGQTIKATMRATLGGGDIIESVKLPPGEDLNEWIAVNSQPPRTQRQSPLSQRLPLPAALLTSAPPSPLRCVCSHSLLQRRLSDLGHLL